MNAETPGIEDSGALPVREAAPQEARGAWSPRRSLGARLVLYLLPVAVVPALVYWLLVDRETDRNEQQMLQTLLADAHRHEAQTLRDEADDAVRSIGDFARKLETIVRRAGVETARALEAGPEPDRPADELVDEPGGPLRSARPGVSIAMVSRKAGLTAQARRDLAATRRLEAPFVRLGLGPVDVSAIAVRTASGVMRAVPGRPLQVGGTNVVEPEFTFPSEATRALAAAPAPEGPAPVAWSAVYEDLFAQSGKIVTAATLVRGGDGRPVAEVGVDWVFARLFESPPVPSRPDDAEMLFAEDGTPLLAAPPAASRTPIFAPSQRPSARAPRRTSRPSSRAGVSASRSAASRSRAGSM